MDKDLNSAMMISADIERSLVTVLAGMWSMRLRGLRIP